MSISVAMPDRFSTRKTAGSQLANCSVLSNVGLETCVAVNRKKERKKEFFGQIITWRDSKFGKHEE